MFAMSMQHVKTWPSPKVALQRGAAAAGLEQPGGRGHTGRGPPAEAINTRTVAGGHVSQVLQMIDNVISYTRDTMGARLTRRLATSGRTTPSAIIATQKASAMPLELQRMGFLPV